MREAINQAIDEEMARDEKVLVMGKLLLLLLAVVVLLLIVFNLN